jgi:hypothetical protein
MAVILGPIPQEQPLEYKIQRVDGTSYVRTWVGPKATLDTIASVEKFLAESIGLTGRGATYTLVARYSHLSAADGTTEEPNETQEIDTDLVPQSIFLNETFQALSAASQLLVRKTIDNRETRADSMTVFDIAVAANEMTQLERPLAEEAWDLLAAGTESFENHAYVLRRSRMASRRFTGTISGIENGKLILNKIGRIWTTTELATHVGNPLLFDVPALEITQAETAKNLFAGWRQTVCRVTDTANGSRSLQEEWKLAKWSLHLYRRQNA